MAEIVFVNPSPNMLKVQQKVSGFGKEVISVKTKDFYNLGFKRLFYFYAGLNVFFCDTYVGEQDKEERIYLLKNNMFSRFKLLGISKDLKNLNPELAHGNIVDLMAFKRGQITTDISFCDGLEEFQSLAKVTEKYGDAKIYTSAMANVGNTKLSFWETDYDLETTIGNDYFVMFDGESKIEVFVYKGNIATISNGKNAIEQFATIIPTIKKFSFKLISEENILRNTNTWEKELASQKVMLLNDYSYFNCSISMPPIWYEKLATHINFRKK